MTLDKSIYKKRTKCFHWIIPFLIFVQACATAPETKEQFIETYKSEFDLTEKKISKNLKNRNFVVWKKDTLFSDLDITDTYLLQNVKIIIDEAYPGKRNVKGKDVVDYCEFHIVLLFVNKDSNNLEIILRNSYYGKYKGKFSNDISNWVYNEEFLLVNNNISNMLGNAYRDYLIEDDRSMASFLSNIRDNISRNENFIGNTINQAKIIEQREAYRNSIFRMLGNTVPDNLVQIGGNRFYTSSSFTQDGRLQGGGRYYTTDSNNLIIKITSWELTGTINDTLYSYGIMVREIQEYKDLGMNVIGGSNSSARLEYNDYRIDLTLTQFDEKALCLVTEIYKK